MLNEKEFVDKVWIDYEKYVNTKEKKDKFYEKHVYKNTESLALLKSVAMFLIVFTITATLVGGTYAAIKTYTENKKIEQQAAKAEDGSYEYYEERHQRSEYKEDIPDWERTLYKYHKIKTYQEYLEAKEVISGLIEMTEEDFKDNFMIVVGTFQARNEDCQGVYIKDILEDDEKLTIIVDTDDEKLNLDVSVKLPIEMDRENIKILEYAEKPEMKGYKPADEIMADYKNYPKEQAIEDNCVIHTLYNDLKGVDQFIEETKKGKNSCVRVITYSDIGVKNITDVEYKDGKYIIEETFIKENGRIEKYYYKGDTFEVNTRVNEKVGFSEITYSLINTKKEATLLEEFNNMIKEEYEKEMERLYDKDTRLATYKYWEEQKGNIFDKSKIDEYDKLYEEEYKKAVEECIDSYFKFDIPYEGIVDGRFGQKKEIFHRYELHEDYKGT